MLLITDFDRTMTREEFIELWRVMRKRNVAGPSRDRYDTLSERAELQSRIDELSDSGGYVGVVESGRDCDMVSYCDGRARRLTAIQFQQLRDHTYEWADGPCCVSLCSTDAMPESYSRDLALEAFEDGHAHIVSEVRFDEEGCYQ